MNTDYDKYLKIIGESMRVRNKIMIQKARQLGLSEGEAAAIMFFYKNKSMDNAADMVKECCVSKAFVSKIIISLLSKKLITIEPDKHDRRARNITLTEAAEQKAKALDLVLINYLDSLFHGITTAQIHELDKIFDIFEKNIPTFDREEKQA